MTPRSDYALTLLTKRLDEFEVLPNEAIIQLVSSQLLMFSKQLEVLAAKEYCKILIRCIFEAKISESHTSLGVITLISVDEEVLLNSLREILSNQDVSDYFTLNEDAQILITYAVSKGLEVDSVNSLVGSAKLLMKSKSKNDYLWRFHYEVSDLRGKSHTSPLNRVIQSGVKKLQVAWQRVFQSVEFLIDFFEQDISFGLIRGGRVSCKLVVKDGVCQTCQSGAKVAYSEFKHCALMRLYEIKDLMSPFINKNDVEMSEGVISSLKENTNSMLQNLKLLHDQIFYSIRLDKMREGRPQGGVGLSLVKSINGEKKYAEVFSECRVEFNSNNGRALEAKLSDIHEQQFRDEYNYWSQINDFRDVYVIWSDDIMRVVECIISNVKHACGVRITNPWNTFEKREESKADLWINVSLIENGLVEIKFRNANSKGRVDSFVKIKRVLNIIRDYGGKYSLGEVEGKQFETCIILPMAHILGDEKYV